MLQVHWSAPALCVAGLPETVIHTPCDMEQSPSVGVCYMQAIAQGIDHTELRLWHLRWRRQLGDLPLKVCHFLLSAGNPCLMAQSIFFQAVKVIPQSIHFFVLQSGNRAQSDAF